MSYTRNITMWGNISKLTQFDIAYSLDCINNLITVTITLLSENSKTITYVKTTFINERVNETFHKICRFETMHMTLRWQVANTTSL